MQDRRIANKSGIEDRAWKPKIVGNLRSFCQWEEQSDLFMRNCHNY